jgi:ABC-type multidrug transport system fused ATPase/permease subunit
VVEALERIVTFILALCALFRLDSRLAVIILGALPFAVLSTEVFVPGSEHRARVLKAKMSSLCDSISEHWLFREQIFYYRAFDYTVGKVREQQEDYMKTSRSNFSFQALVSGVQSVVAFIPPLLVLFLGAGWVMHGSLTTGAIIAALSYCSKVYAPVQDLAGFRNRYRQYRVSMDRLGELTEVECVSSIMSRNIQSGTSGSVTECTSRSISLESRVPFDVIAVPRTTIWPTVEFRDVSFSHDGSCDPVPVLNHVSFMFDGPGIWVLRGGNGAGKSTMIALALGAIVPDGGAVYVNGMEPSTMDDNDLIANIAVVPQHDAVFTDALDSNCSLGKPLSLYDLEQAWKVLHPCGSTDSVDPHLTVGARLLSGGEKKQISLLRVILGDSPILILDEPFGPLDEGTRCALAGWLRTVSKTRLVILVDHGYNSGVFGGDADVRIAELGNRA